MNIRYTFFAAILILLGAGLFLLPDKQSLQELSPENLLAELKDQSRFISTDQIAERIINQDPTLLLIDVRFSDYYSEYSIPGALNIPLEEILNPDWEDYLNQDGIDVVFYSNADVYAQQAWMLASRMNYQNLYVMKGGLNCWFETIIKPVMPAETAPSEAFDLYDFRRGACQYFSGGQLEIEETNAAEIVPVSRKKKSSVVEGGC